MAIDSGTSLAVGDQIGEYRVTGHLAGRTYRAAHVATAKRALIDLGSTDNWRDTAIQMLRAQRTVEMLLHPGVARVVDRGVLADKRPFIITEVPSGLGLADLIARRALPEHETMALVRDIATVLAFAHSRGVVHGALTVRSIVLATGERGFPISICGWGLPNGDISVYAAPELSMGLADGRADVYSLGVIAFRTVTLRFPGEAGIYDVPGVSTPIATLIARMLAIDPSERPDALEVRALAAGLVIPDDVVHPTGPRFNRPKWTPSPEVPITSERFSFASGEIDDPVEE